MKIFKYELRIDVTPIDLPIGSKILCTKLQYGVPVVYVAVSSVGKLESHKFFCILTGQEIPSAVSVNNYLDTLMSQGDSLVIHIFHQKPLRSL